MTPLLWAAGDNPRQPLTEEERALLAAIATIVRFKKREIIYGEGDDANSVFNIVSGVVKSYKTLSDGSSAHCGLFVFKRFAWLGGEWQVCEFDGGRNKYHLIPNANGCA